MEVKQRALKLIKENKVKKVIDENMGVSFEVGEYYVRIFKKPGRTLISCSCENHARYCLEQPLCKHKLAALTFWMTEVRNDALLPSKARGILA